MDYSNSIKNFENYIGNIGWEYNHFAIEKIFEESLEAKENILNVLRKHPKFDEEKQAIVFSADFCRDVDHYTCRQFRNWMERIIEFRQDAAELTYTNASCLKDIIYYLAGSSYQFMTDEYSIDRINSICQENTELGLTKFKVHLQQKRSRLVGKFCKAIGLDKEPEYQQRFAQYGDAINPLKVGRFTVISVNPADFVMMSNGTSWRSCHNPDKETYSGCNCSGGISHALDKSSIIMYTVHPDYVGDLQMAKKVDRCVFFVDEDLQHFVQSKVYPDGTEQKSSEFREIFQMVWSQCTGQPNLWTKKSLGDSVWDTIRCGSGSTAYPDFNYCGRNIIVHFFPSGADEDNFKTIYVGSRPICVECGSRHDIEDQINCCTYFSSFHCPNCGEDWQDEDDLYYSSFHDAYGCPECMSWNSWCEDYFWDNDDTEYVENIGEYIPVCYMEYHDEDFVRCEECGDWIYIGYKERYEYYETDDGEFFCKDCSDSVEYCADCGSCYRIEDMVEINGEYYCGSCAEDHEEDSDSIVA